ncbi:MAG: sialidase family protein [Candidatus Latescibacteria bacterium]|nr:sialidase family protein [Candidatus Latescibacterota bacterium]
MRLWLSVVLILPAVILFGCDASERSTQLFTEPIASPAKQISGEPNLVVGEDGNTYLSWIEKVDGAYHALRYAMFNGDGWSVPATVAEGKNWFVNWADIPSLAVLDDGTITAHWLERSDTLRYSYDVKLAQSVDGRNTWTSPVTPHRDGTRTEHGFVSMLPWSDGGVLAVWLDGRNFANEKKDEVFRNMTLRAAVVDREGRLSDEVELDARVCECCGTAAIKTAGGALVAYRDRSDANVRDISVVRWHNGHWSPPYTLYQDDWEINGCPVNGPALAADGERISAAWFTAAQDSARVQVILSDDEGATFSSPVRVDDGNPIGRVDLVMLEDGSSLVSWMENRDDDALLRIRRVHQDGQMDRAVTLATLSAARASGFPQMVRNRGTFLFAWTHVDEDGNNIRTAKGSLSP